MKNDPLGERMKRYEAVTRSVLPLRTYTLIRLDGKAFHSYCRGLERPFDAQLMADMDATCEAVCAELTGVAFGYVQSDEISILLTDFASNQTQPVFGGVVAKLLSISASAATYTFNNRRPSGGRALFDSRVFTMSDPTEVANYFVWRQRDAVKNSISMAAQAVFSHRELHGLNGAALQEKLFSERDINWNAYPAGFKRGRLTQKATRTEEVSFTHRRTHEVTTTSVERSYWETAGAPHFVAEPGSEIDALIPKFSP